jgi:hypothetical protein
MQDKQPPGHQGQEEQPGAGSGIRAMPGGTLGLPSWESFPVADRRRLVSAILQTARRQVAGGPTSGLSKT